MDSSSDLNFGRSGKTCIGQVQVEDEHKRGRVQTGVYGPLVDWSAVLPFALRQA